MGFWHCTMENVGIDKDFWRGRRVFLTGHTGFKGSWLSLWLQSLGAEVTGFALPPEAKGLFERAQVGTGMTSVIGDIREIEALTNAMTSCRPEVVIHMAAQALVRVSYDDPLMTFATNVMGTANVLEAVRHCPGVHAVINVTSDKCYENREWLWGYRENEPLGGHDPYSASKACAEIVGAAMRSSFFPPDTHAHHGVAIASARAGNVIGGGDTARDRLIPDIIAAFEAGRPVVVRNPVAVRPWQHVLEPLSGYLMLAEKLSTEGVAYAEAWNFGPRDEDMQPVARIADAMVTRWGAGASWTHDTSIQPHEAQVLRLDCSKVRQRLGWAPRWGLDRALNAIVDWHRAALDGADMRALTLRQIEEWQT
jgi:CDP-glucose 4,6-dehydratase